MLLKLLSTQPHLLWSRHCPRALLAGAAEFDCAYVSARDALLVLRVFVRGGRYQFRVRQKGFDGSRSSRGWSTWGPCSEVVSTLSSREQRLRDNEQRINDFFSGRLVPYVVVVVVVVVCVDHSFIL